MGYKTCPTCNKRGAILQTSNKHIRDLTPIKCPHCDFIFNVVDDNNKNFQNVMMHFFEKHPMMFQEVLMN